MKKVLNYVSRIIPDRLYLKIKYRLKTKKKLDLKSPKTFNEKIQWLKLYDRKDIYTTMVDKNEVKEYVANIIGKKYIIPTLGVYKNFDDINFDDLPNQFVIKCTHDSGGVEIVKNKKKLDIESIRKKINKCLKQNYYYSGREWPYKNVEPKIIVEKYMTNNGKDINDYKFFCFNGDVKFFKIDFNRFNNHQANYYDLEGNLLKFGEIKCPPDYEKKLNMPKNLKLMISLAKKISKNNIFVRVDFYEVNNEVYFGEITFYPDSGFGKFTSDEWDKKLGDLINLSDLNKKGDE